MDFTKRAQVRSALRSCLIVARLIIIQWETERKMLVEASQVRTLRENIRKLREQLAPLPLWYPL